MDFPEPPFEALVLFKHLSLRLFLSINCFFTWVAARTAAVSFWRIRAINNGSTIASYSQLVAVTNKSDGCRDTKDLTSSVQQQEQEGEEKVKEKPTTESPQASFNIYCDSSVNVGDDGRVKGRFTVYYWNDGDDRGDNELTDVEGSRDGEVDGVWGSGEWELWYGILESKRRRDLELYRCQDLTVLNGNVVRLWDDVRSRSRSTSIKHRKVVDDRWLLTEGYNGDYVKL